MKLKAVSGIMLTLLLIGMLILTFNIQSVKAGGTIYIRADGSVYPDTAPISTVDNITYTFTGNIYDEIVVERNNILIDGNGYTLQGSSFSGEGFNLTNMNNVTIKNTIIKGFLCGIYLESASNNAFSGNNITENNFGGIYLGSSSNNTISGNNITANNDFGIWFYLSSNNILRGNSIAKNKYNFGIEGWSPSDFFNDVDASNTVDGKPVYYWINERDMSVPLDAGYVALVNCKNITVQNLNLTNNLQGALLAYTTNSTITKNNITNNGYGIYHIYSSNNNVIGNSIADNGDGIFLIRSSNNYIAGNNIASNCKGIHLFDSSKNHIVGNNITTNSWEGIDLRGSNNSIYHNNFIENTDQVYLYGSGFANFWDNGYPSGGNYWSDYNGTDSNLDGIGDSSYFIDVNNQDNYPLMGMFSDFPVIHLQQTFRVTTICNSTISDFDLVINLETGDHMLWFDVTGPDDTVGFCRIMIPRGLMEDPYTVRVDGEEVPANELPISNSTYAFLYFTYVHSKHHVVIIPEFPSFLILPLFMIATLPAVIVYRRKHAL